MNRSPFCCLLLLVASLGCPSVGLFAQDPTPAKGPDPEVAQKLALLKEVVLDKKCARDEEGVGVIDALLQKSKGGLDAKDQLAIVKGLDSVFTMGKVRPHDKTGLYIAASTALGYCGVEGAKVLKNAYDSNRFPERKEWLPLREQLLKYLGRTKDELMVKFLCKEACTSHEAALAAAAGEALGEFDESKDALRKEIVSELLVKYGALSETAGQLGSQNTEAQNANDFLAAVKDKWVKTLGRLTRQNFDTFRKWQEWHNKNKNKPW